jgi:hypothetical protein
MELATTSSVRRYVSVAQDIRFGHQIIQEVFCNIAYAYDANEFAVGHYGQIPHAVSQH